MTFIKENKIPLLVVLGVTIFFGIFLYVTFFIIQPGTFLSSLDGDILIPTEAQGKERNWKPLLLAENFVSLFSSGVSLGMVAPDIGKIAAHPSVIRFVEPAWPILEITIFILNILLFWLVFKYALSEEKRFIVFVLLAMFITISMVILARPDHNTIPDFDYRYAGPPYYFYCLFLALLVSIAIRSKEYSGKIIVSVLIVIFSFQQVFSFHALRLEEESKLRSAAIVTLDNTLLMELKELSANSPIVMPNLTGAHIFQGMPGYNLADYLLFFDRKMPVRLIQNAYMPPDVKTHIVETVGNLRASTSPRFIDALKKSGVIQSYYTSSALMRYTNVTDKIVYPKTILLDKDKKILIKRGGFDPETLNSVGLSFYTDNVSGNLELAFYFKNDFNIEGEVGKIRIDDFTPYTIQNGKRFYNIQTNMLQIYPYALSDRISELTLRIPEEKNPFVTDVYLK